MKANDELMDVVEDIYSEMYERAEPGADYEELKEEAPCDPPIYKRHYLDADTQDDIIEKHLDENSISGVDRSKVSMTVNLGAAPITSKENRVEIDD